MNNPVYDKTMINVASFLLTFSPQGRNIHFPEDCIYFLYFWNSRPWTKSQLWVVLSQYVTLIETPLTDLVKVTCVYLRVLSCALFLIRTGFKNWTSCKMGHYHILCFP